MFCIYPGFLPIGIVLSALYIRLDLFFFLYSIIIIKVSSHFGTAPVHPILTNVSDKMDRRSLLEALKPASESQPQHGTSTPPDPARPSSVYQPVSLDDLFKSINGPSTVTPTNPAPQQQPAAPQQHVPNHRSKLLGMLSSSTTPEASRPSSDLATDKDQSRRTSLLNALKSPPPPADVLPLTEPVITHPGPAPVVSPPITSPPQLSTSKSIFDFVSPFDAIAPVKPAPAPSTSSASPNRTSNPTPAPASSSPVKKEAPKVTSPPAAAVVPRQVQAVRSVSRQSSASPPTPPKKQHPSPKWPLIEWSKNSSGSGPKTLPPGEWSVDLSQPNLDSLVNQPGAVRITPITMLKTEHGGFRRGRAVAHTNVWIAYALPRGRVRLIAKGSGARTVLQLDSTEAVVDIAATEEALATVSADGTVSAFSVPAYWDVDDPPTPLIFSLGPPDSETENPLGDVNQVEWIRRDGASANYLAIGGTEGAVIVKTSDYGADNPAADPRQLFTSNKVLKTSGVIVQFCLNPTHQAIGLISSSGYFCLYSVATLSKVWHRQLPSTNTSLPLSSARFCEAHVLVGRGNDTMFDLVQITTELAVVTTVKLTTPDSAPTFAHAEYDSATETLFIAPYDRGSVFALHYALKGQQPLRNLGQTSNVRAFDAVAEFVMAPVTTMSVGHWNGETQIAFSTPSGISQAVFEQAVLPPRPRSSEEKRKQQKPEAQPANAPKTSKRSVSSVEPVEIMKKEPRPSHDSRRSQDIDIPMASPAQLVRQTSARAPAAPRLDAEALSSVTDAIAAHLKTALPAIIREEIKTLLPDAVRTEVRSAMGEHVSPAIKQSLQHVGRDVESAIAPTVPRTLATLVQPAIERAIQQSISQAVVPALNAATTRVYDQLTADLKAEMVQIRKDLVTEQGEALGATNTMLHTMAGNIESLQRQMTAMQARSPPQTRIGPLPTQVRSQMFSPPQAQQQAPVPQQPYVHPLPPPQQLEDRFLAALSQQSTIATIELVENHTQYTNQLFPPAPARSPLSPAVLLTLLHRLSVAISASDPTAPAPLPQLAQWINLVQKHLDPRDPAIAGYFPRVADVAIPAIRQQLQYLANAPSPSSQAAAGSLRVALSELERKMQQ